MLVKDLPIQKKLMRLILFISGIVLTLTCLAFVTYEYFSFRQTTIRQLSTLGKIVAENSTASLAFNIPEDANEVLNALKAEKDIVTACIYDTQGEIFARFPTNAPDNAFPPVPQYEGYDFTKSHLEGYQSIVKGTKQLGTLYLKHSLGAMYERFRLYGIIIVLIITLSTLLAYILSRILQKRISKPILDLTEIALAISERQDYSVRASINSKDELGTLTDAFNKMLIRIQEQTTMLNEFNQTLEQRVADRTSELAYVNKELESFSYSISHDLRAPLRAIHGYMNIFSEDYASKLDDEAKRLMDIILSNAKEMGQLIDDLLSFSQLGRTELVKTMVPMKSIANATWEKYERMEEARDIEFVLHDVPDAFADKGTIKQVWINLISNALKYSRNKEKIKIEIAFEDKEYETIYCVKDNGNGFDMQYYNKLFGVFQRLHSKKEFEGTGVGLAIVKRIINKHGGTIWAEAEVNNGAAFYFSLPKNKNHQNQ